MPRWDALGRRDTVAYSNGMIFAFGYDRDGTQRFLCTKQGVTVPAGGSGDVSIFRLVNDSVDSDGLVKRVNDGGLGAPQNCLGGTPTSNTTNTYDNRHQLKSQTGDGRVATYRYDGSGNMIQTVRNGATYLDTMDPAHNR